MNWKTALARALLALGAILLTPLFFVGALGLAAVQACEATARWVVLWAVYAGDKEKRDKDEWKGR